MRAAVRFVVRLAAAFALMAAAVWMVGLDRIRIQIEHADLRWFAAAVAVMAVSQVISVLRWETIARIFGLRVRTGAMAVAYAQGMTLNVLLPGATLGGDALRSVRLQQLGNPLGVSALSVLLDRLSGLWILCALSLLTGLGLFLLVGFPAAHSAAGPAAHPPGPPWLARHAATFFGIYLLGLVAVCALPWLPLRPRPVPSAADHPLPLVRAAVRIWNRISELHELALSQRGALGRSIWSSAAVQVLCAVTLWLCTRAVGGHAAYWQVQAVAAPIFVAGALPVSYGGFGAREMAALAVFPLVGLGADLGLTASVLYGFVSVVLGLLAAPAFAIGRHRHGG